MILVDTSVWIDHLRVADRVLAELLLDEQVLCHPFVVGELACGTLKRRLEFLTLIQSLPQAPLVEHEEVLAFVDTHALMGSGLGWVDAHLLSSGFLVGAHLWTRDTRLSSVSRRLGVLFIS